MNTVDDRDAAAAAVAFDANAPVTMDLLLATLSRNARTVSATIRDYKTHVTSRVDALEQRVRELESRPAIKDAGVWHTATVYKPGDIVSHQGSGWICSADHVAGDGIDHAKFRLLVKKGADARDAR